MVNGKKWCSGHDRMEPIEDFPQGSGQCHEIKKAIQNITNAAANQGCAEWLVELRNQKDQKPWKRLLMNYQVRREVAGGAKKMGVYPVLQYREEVRRERPLQKNMPTYCQPWPKYHQNIANASPTHRRNIAKTLPEHCQHIARPLPKHCQNNANKLQKHRQNIAETFPKHCRNIAKSLPKHCQGIAKNITKSLPFRCQNIARSLLKLGMRQVAPKTHAAAWNLGAWGPGGET